MPHRRWIRLFVVLSILTLFTVGQPAAAADQEARACTPRAVASEPAGVFQQAAAVGLPESLEMGPCNASLDCGDGNVISCTGNWSCTASQGQGYVECDGNRTTCPNRCEIWLNCCGGPTGCHVGCQSNAGDCQQGSDWVQCDGGFVIACDDLCSGFC